MAEEQLDPTQPATPADPAPAPAPDPAAPAPEPTSQPQPDPAPPAPEPVPQPEQPAPAPAEQPQEPQAARPVIINQFTRRSGDEPLLGSWVDIVSGDQQGRFGHYFEDVSNDLVSGYPDRVHVRTRDARNEVVEVGLGEVRPSERTGGR